MRTNGSPNRANRAGSRFQTFRCSNEASEVQYYITTGIDITDRFRADQELLKSETQFRSIWEASCEPMFLTDPAGTIVKVNAAFAAMLGADAGSLEGTEVAGLFHPEEREELREYHRARFASARSISISWNAS